MPWQKYLANAVRVHNYENVTMAAKGWQIILTLEETAKIKLQMEGVLSNE